MIKACLNGPRDKRDHPRVPMTATELAQDGVEAERAGAAALHIHPKDEDGADSLDAQHLMRALVAVKSRVRVPVGVTTGDWILPDPRQRIAAIQKWRCLPDFASVNFHEEGAHEVADTLLQLGVPVEAGLFHSAAVDRWREWPGHRRRCVRVLIELRPHLDEGLIAAEADRLLTLVRSTQTATPILIHGEDASCWPALRYAAAHGLHGRIGLEDTLTNSAGETAVSNASLMREAQQLTAEIATENEV